MGWAEIQYRYAVFRIRLRIGSAFDGRLDPDADKDPGGLRRAKKEGKNLIQKAVIWHKKDKEQ
jgi:hypothetical protein